MRSLKEILKFLITVRRHLIYFLKNFRFRQSTFNSNIDFTQYTAFSRDPRTTRNGPSLIYVCVPVSSVWSLDLWLFYILLAHCCLKAEFISIFWCLDFYLSLRDIFICDKHHHRITLLTTV